MYHFKPVNCAEKAVKSFIVAVNIELSFFKRAINMLNVHALCLKFSMQILLQLSINASELHGR